MSNYVFLKFANRESIQINLSSVQNVKLQRESEITIIGPVKTKCVFAKWILGFVHCCKVFKINTQKKT